MFPAHIQQPCLNVYCLALYASAQIGFSIAQLTVGLSIIVHHLYLDVFINSSPNPRIQTKPFIFTHIGISCLIVMDIISMFFSYFPLFSEADSSQGGPQDRHVESSHSGQVCRGSDLRLHVRRGHRSNTPPAATHCHTLCLGKRRTAHDEGAIGQSRDGPVNSQG